MQAGLQPVIEVQDHKSTVDITYIHNVISIDRVTLAPIHNEAATATEISLAEHR